MADKTYKLTQIVGTSSESFEDAVSAAVERAARNLHGLSWFEVVEQRGHLGADGTIGEYQVKLDVAFELD